LVIVVWGGGGGGGGGWGGGGGGGGGQGRVTKAGVRAQGPDWRSWRIWCGGTTIQKMACSTTIQCPTSATTAGIS